MKTLGIDIGGSSVKAALLDGDTVAWTSAGPTYQRPTTDQLVAAVRETIRWPLPPLEGVGLCVPGLLDRATQTITLSVNVPGLVGVPLPQILARVLNVELPQRLWITNDAAATGYDIWATRRPEGRLLVIAIGTGIGASVIDDGKLLLVDGDSPGHLGQVDVGPFGEPVVGPDGGLGSAEAYLGGPVIATRYQADPRAILDAWKGDEFEVKALSRLIRISHAIYRPQHICLAGGLGVRMGHLLPAIRRHVEDRLTSIARPGWTLSIGGDDFHAARGAARLATT
ncbi:MAG: ROK family protein [Tepidisphaerales bacterium]